ncbi:hypothetical protein [Rhodococcus sp. NPDC058514]|uniref:hypothetical protein n=1 Tax=unclassified Rhodococcus (in: high G+C Gram-positive bacteria) TaxID=192944 RepID=UPI003668D9F2
MSVDEYEDQAASSGAVARGLRALSGVVAAGVVVLALVVVVASYLGGERGFPGPGRVSVGAHIVAAVLVLLSQRVADHRRGVAGIFGSVGVFFITGLLLWTQWWR